MVPFTRLLPFENMPASLAGAVAAGGAVAVTAAGAGVAGAGAAGAGAGAVATLSGFATPELSGGACARAMPGASRAAASNIHIVDPRIRESTPAFIALPPISCGPLRRAAVCRAADPRRTFLLPGLLLRSLHGDLHPLQQRHQVLTSGAVRRGRLQHVAHGIRVAPDPRQHVLRRAVIGEHGLDDLQPQLVVGDEPLRHLA